MKTSLFAKYKSEREGKKIIEMEMAFLIYEIKDNLCYVEDVFVDESLRGKKIAARLTDLAAKDAIANGCKTLVTSVCLKAKNNTVPSIRAILNYGFYPYSSDKQMIWFKKEIS